MAEPAVKRAGWTRVAFGDVVRLSKERSPDPEADGLERYIGLDHLDPGELKVRRWGDIADGTTFTNVFRPGQVLFGKRRAYQRKVGVAAFSGVCSGDIYVFEPRDPAVLLPGLLPFICQTDGFFDYAIGTSAGSLSPRTNWKSVAQYEFALPPMEEQARIVQALSAVDGLAEHLRREALAADTLRASVGREVFEGTRGFAAECLGDVLRVVTGGTPSRSQSSFWGGGIPWVKTAEVDFNVIFETEESITEQGLAASAAKVLPRNSVLVALYGQGPTRGRVAMLGVEAATNQACAAILPNDHLDPWFVYYYLESSYEGLRAQPNLNLSMIKDFPIPVPPKRAQAEAVVVIREVAVARRALSARLAHLQTLRAIMLEKAVA